MRKHTIEQNKLRLILQSYGCEEFGDSIVDEICELFGHPMTPEEEFEKGQEEPCEICNSMEHVGDYHDKMYTKGKWHVQGFAVKYGNAFDNVICECKEPNVLENAQLIASAPLLLSACKMVIDYAKDPDSATWQAVEVCKEAIQQAEGK